MIAIRPSHLKTFLLEGRPVKIWAPVAEPGALIRTAERCKARPDFYPNLSSQAFSLLKYRRFTASGMAAFAGLVEGRTKTGVFAKVTD